jgi:hypothetical protein
MMSLASAILSEAKSKMDDGFPSVHALCISILEDCQLSEPDRLVVLPRWGRKKLPKRVICNGRHGGPGAFPCRDSLHQAGSVKLRKWHALEYCACSCAHSLLISSPERLIYRESTVAGFWAEDGGTVQCYHATATVFTSEAGTSFRRRHRDFEHLVEPIDDSYPERRAFCAHIRWTLPVQPETGNKHRKARSFLPYCHMASKARTFVKSSLSIPSATFDEPGLTEQPVTAYATVVAMDN